MGEKTRDPVDHARTFRPHAGEWLIDRASWPGLALIALGVASLVSCLAAGANQIHGWMLVTGIASLALFGIGAVWLSLERRRVRAVEKRWHEEHSTSQHD
ncbi:MAG: protein UsfY [Mycobacterium sp.]